MRFELIEEQTRLLNSFKSGDHILDVVGPLGKPSEIENFDHVVVAWIGDSMCGLKAVAFSNLVRSFPKRQRRDGVSSRPSANLNLLPAMPHEKAAYIPRCMPCT